jgi:hypothetical protein
MKWAPLPDPSRANSGGAQPSRADRLGVGPTRNGRLCGGCGPGPVWPFLWRPARGLTRVTRRRGAWGKEGPHGTRGIILVAGMEYSEPFAAPPGWPWIRCSLCLPTLPCVFAVYYCVALLSRGAYNWPAWKYIILNRII